MSLYESASEKALKASASPTAATFALDGLRVLSKLSPDHWTTDQTLSATLTLTAVKWCAFLVCIYFYMCVCVYSRGRLQSELERRP